MGVLHVGLLLPGGVVSMDRRSLPGSHGLRSVGGWEMLGGARWMGLGACARGTMCQCTHFVVGLTEQAC